MRLPIAMYGKREMLLFAGIFLGLSVLLLLFKIIALGILSLIGMCFVVFFFRDPARRVSAGPKEIIAPADGKIIEIEKVFDKTYVNGEVYKVSIFLSLLDVHINRAPCAGVVERVQYRKGRFHHAGKKLASDNNERTIIGIYNRDHDTRLIVKQVAGVIARRIVCELREGQEVLAGQKFGMIKFGSRTELHIPVEHFVLKAHLNEYVKAGTSVLGELK